MGKIDPGFSRQDDLQLLLEHAFFLQLPDEGHPFFRAWNKATVYPGIGRVRLGENGKCRAIVLKNARK